MTLALRNALGMDGAPAQYVTTTHRAFDGLSGPSANANDGSAYSLGTVFDATSACSVTAVRFWLPDGTQDVRTVRVYRMSDSTLVATGGSTLTVTPAMWQTWQEITLAAPFTPTVGVQYMAVISFPAGGQYPATSQFFNTGAGTSPGLNYGPIHLPSSAQVSGAKQGSFLASATPGLPDGSFNSTNYWVGPVVTAQTVAPVTYASGQFFPFFG